uniref:Uncharacterized protein n=1 Tax=Anguilla anguilla TaxID=7936 RepID=A0A0E9RKL0_ANGAN
MSQSEREFRHGYRWLSSEHLLAHAVSSVL